MLPIEPVFAASMPSTWVSQAWASLPRAAARHVHGSGAQDPSFGGEHACSGLGRHLDSSAVPCTCLSFSPQLFGQNPKTGGFLKHSLRLPGRNASSTLEAQAARAHPLSLS